MPWSDDYVGLPFAKGGRDRATGLDCYGLVRLALAEKAGVILARFDDVIEIDDAGVIRSDVQRFAAVPPGAEQEFDLVIINEPVRVSGRWQSAPVHIGIVVQPGLLLHINKNTTARVDPLAGMDVSEIRRVALR